LWQGFIGGLFSHIQWIAEFHIPRILSQDVRASLGGRMAYAHVSDE
jgi:hypothetical protein